MSATICNYASLLFSQLSSARIVTRFDIYYNTHTYYCDRDGYKEFGMSGVRFLSALYRLMWV